MKLRVLGERKALLEKLRKKQRRKTKNLNNLRWRRKHIVQGKQAN